jgi:tRNA(Ile)-lysidine synthase
MAELARDEEAWWTAELARLGPQILMHGRPVRGGGRAASDGMAIEVARLAQLAPAMQRRILRHAAEELGVAIDFPATEALRTLALLGKAGQKRELAQGLRAERTHRELRLRLAVEAGVPVAAGGFTAAIPGEVEGFGVRLRVEGAEPAEGKTATLRNWQAGDRVQLRHSSGPRKVKEVLERLRVTGSGRALWPVLEVDGRIVWMQGVEVEPGAGVRIVAVNLNDSNPGPILPEAPREA